MRSIRAASVLVGFVTLGLPRQVPAQQRLGAEFQVNLNTIGNQTGAALDLDDEGDFIVVWQGGGDGFNFGIFARAFGNGGTPQSPEFQVNSYTPGDQARPSLAVDREGAAIVTWSTTRDGSFEGIAAQRLDAFGEPEGAEFQVNTYTPGNQTASAVARTADGQFLVVWESQQDGDGRGIFGRIFSNLGSPLAIEFQVNTNTGGSQSRPSVAVSDQDESFAIVWESEGSDGSDFGVFGRRLNGFSSFIGAEFQVNTHTLDAQRKPDVTFDDNGDFVVVWTSVGQDGGGDGVFGQRFAADNLRLGVEFQVSVLTVSSQSDPVVDRGADGTFIVAWASPDATFYGVFGRRFSSSGAPVSGELQINTYEDGNQGTTALGAGPSGRFVVAWSSAGQEGVGTDVGIFAQRFGQTSTVDIDGDGAVLPLTDGLLFLRSLFGFTGQVLISGAVNSSGCTRCTAPAIEAFLATLH